MTPGSARLGTENPHLLQGSALDRSRPLQFRLDGRTITGFAGDTVLSAVLASGISSAGQRQGMDLALTMRHAPAIVPSASGDPKHALPMERSLATDGADYVTLAGRHRGRLLSRLWSRDRMSLQLDLAGSDAQVRPWLGMAGAPGPVADLVIIGGGVAGMSAALEGARNGLRVVIVEATPRLGGHSRLFGTMEGEETPDQSIARLSQAVTASRRISVLTSAEAFALRSGVVRLHQVEMNDNVPKGRVLDIAAQHVILATGAIERLPLFAGNRLPGVVGALEAFELAQHYGIWPGRSALIATSSSPAYRLAMLAQDAGVDVARIVDSRLRPQSRFVEFAKAYGITQMAGSGVANAVQTPKSRGLMVALQLVTEGFSAAEAPIAADRLIVCGGWQPDLTLWHMAGGESHWNDVTSRLEPATAPAGIALAGSAAGWTSRQTCIESGGEAVEQLLGKTRRPLHDQVIDPLYETPDGIPPIGDLSMDAGPPAYLADGHGYLASPRTLPRSRPWWSPLGQWPSRWSLADTPHPLNIAAVVSGVQLGAIPAASAGVVAQERGAMVGVSTGVERPAVADNNQPLVPRYLESRYPGARLFVVAAVDKRVLSAGALIHANPDATDPLHAIGVVVRIIDRAAIALVSASQDQLVSLREPGRSIPVQVMTPYTEGMDLAAALGSGAGPA